jgi:hypothetical protein
LYISICWLSVIRVLFCIFWSLHSWRSWWGRKQGIMRYHNSLCADTLEGLFEKCPLVSVSLRKHYLLRN